MAIVDYLRVARRRWRVVVACALLATLGAALYVVAATPVYNASVQLFISTPDGDSSLSSAFNGSEFGQERVKSYADIVNSPVVVQPVINSLHLDETAAQLGADISSSAPLDTVLLNVNVRRKDRVQAATIADAVGAQLVVVVQKLETPNGGGASPVRVSVVKQAAVPDTAVSPKKKFDLGVGVVLGLVVGFGIALLLERLDTTLKTVAGILSTTGGPTLGTIGFDADSTRRPLVVSAEPKSVVAEGFRQLRTNLQFVDVDERPKSVVITSSVAGEGKSTVAANLALAMAEQGQRILLVDGDLRQPRVAKYLGVEGAVGLTTILSKRVQPREVIQSFGNGCLFLLPSGQLPPNPSELLGSKEMAKLLTYLEEQYDMVIVDAPPLLPVTDAAVLAAIVDGVLLVVKHGKSKREELVRAISVLHNVDGRLFGCVLNSIPPRGPDSTYYQTYYGEAPGGKRFGRSASGENGRSDHLRAGKARDLATAVLPVALDVAGESESGSEPATSGGGKPSATAGRGLSDFG